MQSNICHEKLLNHSLHRSRGRGANNLIGLTQ